MFRDDAQASRAISALLSTLPALRSLWTSSGPTRDAIALLQADGGALSSGERTLLLSAFCLWNGEGDLRFADVLELDASRLDALLTLALAIKRGATDVDVWIQCHVPPLRAL